MATTTFFGTHIVCDFCAFFFSFNFKAIVREASINHVALDYIMANSHITLNMIYYVIYRSFPL